MLCFYFGNQRFILVIRVVIEFYSFGVATQQTKC